MKIRRASPADADALLAIYRPIVENTTISFELVPPTEQAFADRIAATLSRHEWLVGEVRGVICGYAYATPHRPREAYQHAVETSVYVHPEHYGNGFGKQLYQALFPALDALGFHNAYAGIALPNPASIALHQAVGFEPVGVFREIGYKQDAWHDVSWWQRSVASIVREAPAMTIDP